MHKSKITPATSPLFRNSYLVKHTLLLISMLHFRIRKTVVTCKIKRFKILHVTSVKYLQNICKHVLEVVTCKIKQFYNIFTSRLHGVAAGRRRL